MKWAICSALAIVFAHEMAADPNLVPEEVKQSLTKACKAEKSPGASGASSNEPLSLDSLLAELFKIYRIELSGKEMSKPLKTSILNRLQDCREWADPLAECNVPASVATDKPVLVNHPTADLNTRKALLALIQRSATNAEFAAGRVEFQGTDSFTVSADNSKWHEAAITALYKGEANLSFRCNAAAEPRVAIVDGSDDKTPKDVMDAVDILVVGGASLVDGITFGTIQGEGGTTQGEGGSDDVARTSPFALLDISKPFTQELILTKDPGEFASSSPKAAEIGLSIEGAKTSSLGVDAALGYSLSRSDTIAKSVLCEEEKKAQAGGASQDSNKKPKPVFCKPGNKRAYTAYLAYTQKQTEEKLFDETLPRLANGDAQVVSREFAYGTFTAGLRADYEFIGYVDQETLRRNIGSKSSLSIEYLTDNFQEFEATKAAATWHPPAWFDIHRIGYRRNVDLAPVGDRISLKWDVNSVFDYINYIEPPLDFDSPIEDDRINVSDYARWGFDFKADTTFRLPFTLKDDSNQLVLGYKHKYRKPLDGSFTDAGLNVYSVSMKKFLGVLDSVTIEYEDGRHPDSLVDRDNWTIKASLKAKLSP